MEDKDSYCVWVEGPPTTRNDDVTWSTDCGREFHYPAGLFTFCPCCERPIKILREPKEGEK